MTPGALIVRKTITGPGAGLQGEITIQPVCDGTALPALVIPAGTPAGFRSQLYPKLAAGTVCTITESGNGSNTAVSVVVTGDDQVTVPPGGIVTAELTDTYNLNPGSLVVNKTIAGAGAGQQGQITITVDLCQQRRDNDVATPVRHSRRDDRSRIADLHRHSRRLGLHGGRDPGRQPGRTGSTEAGQRVGGDGPRRRYRHGRSERHLPDRRTGGQQDDHRRRGRLPG